MLISVVLFGVLLLGNKVVAKRGGGNNYNLPQYDRKMCTATGVGALATMDGST